MTNKQDFERLQEIRETMQDLLEEASNLVRINGSKIEYQRAKSYWIGQIDSALGGRNHIGETYSLDKSINELEAHLPPEEEEED